MGKNKIFLFIILIAIIFFLFTTVSCGKTKEQIETEIDEEVEDVGKEVLEETKEVKEEPPAVETEEEAPAVEVEEKIPEYSFVSKTGEITSDEIWSGEIYITGDIIVVEPATLTILPGTKVIFSAHSDDQHSGGEVPMDEWIAQHDDPTQTLEYAQSHCVMDVFTLIARGTPDEMIIFTSDSENPDGADWQHIQVGYGSIVEYCVFEYSRAALDVAPDTGGSVIVSNNIMRHNLWAGLAIHENSTTMVTNNTIYHSGGHQGIAVLGNPILENNDIRNCKVGVVIFSNVSPTLKNNIFIDNDYGVTITDNSTPTLEGNIISSPNGAGQDWIYKGEAIYFACTKDKNYGDVTGINIINSSPIIRNNQIKDCANIISIIGESSPVITGNIIKNGRNNGIFFQGSFEGSPQIYENNFDNSNNIGMSSSCSIEAINNWWGTANPEEIEERIWHGYDDSSLGIVTYEPFLLQPVEFD